MSHNVQGNLPERVTWFSICPSCVWVSGVVPFFDSMLHKNLTTREHIFSGHSNCSQTRSNVLAIQKGTKCWRRKSGILFKSDFRIAICAKLLNLSTPLFLLINFYSIRKFLKSVQSFRNALMFFRWGGFPFPIQFLSILSWAAFFNQFFNRFP